jgi:hypothetical protein
MRCLGTPAIFKWLGELIYIGHQLKLTIWNHWAVSCVGIGTSDYGASVLPVTHKLKLAVGFSDASAAELATTGLTDDIVSVQPVPLDLHVAVALVDVIAPTPCSDVPPVQPVLKVWLLHA